MTEALLTMMAALAAAIVWIGFQQRRLTTTTKRLAKAEQRLRSAKLSLTEAKTYNEAAEAEVIMLRTIMLDVAKGEADVWIENGVVRAQRKTAGTPPLH
jgi:cytochrome oxidase assembly protein ShyY1